MKTTLYVVTNGTEYAYWARGGYWSTADKFEGKCLIDEDDTRDVLRSFGEGMEGDPAWIIREVSIEVHEAI